MNKEIERKYSIDEIPNNIKISQIIDIEQAIIYKDCNTIIRIRKINNRKNQTTQYVYTIKTKGDIQYEYDSDIGKKYEIENNILEKEYEELIQRKISNIIRKTRIDIPIENCLKVEIDIYYEYLEGLVTAEVEFPNEEMAKTFNKPNWLGEELGYKEFSNRKLAEMNKEQFRSKVTEEFMERNKFVINKLEELIEKSY